MYSHNPKSNAHFRKNLKTADRKGGGSTLTVSLTVKYPFFFDDFPWGKERRRKTEQILKLSKSGRPLTYHSTINHNNNSGSLLQ